ncbi:hypothetical protein OG21DRAFT_1095055 [Imleria badia]|nr:hypothetical protein OG21DRAFT_1095055 [Imleria badia]
MSQALAFIRCVPLVCCWRLHWLMNTILISVIYKVAVTGTGMGASRAQTRTLGTGIRLTMGKGGTGLPVSCPAVHELRNVVLP